MHTENVRRVSFYALAAQPLPRGGVVIDGVPFVSSSLPTLPAHLCALGEGEPPRWRICKPHKTTAWYIHERSSVTYGPLRQVFQTAQIVLVYGTQASSQEYNQQMLERVYFIANTAHYQGGFAITALSDSHAESSRLLQRDSRSNIIVPGGADVNSFAHRAAATAPIKSGGWHLASLRFIGLGSFGTPCLESDTSSSARCTERGTGHRRS